MTAASADLGLIGLAVMGENLVLNVESRGYTVAVFNRTTARVDDFLGARAKGKRVVGTHTVKDLVAALKRPRKVMMMVKAGAAVDETIAQVAPLLEPGDILIDGGNTHFPDTTRRTQAMRDLGVLYIGTGVSGGEEGALLGPSIMPGGNPDAWPHVKPIFQAIAAKVEGGVPCCDWVGRDGAGHFVKMVHNGIEYGDMQLICESYHLMRELLGLKAAELRDVFDQWNRGRLDSYLIEITRDIFGYRDPKTGQPMVDLILDAAQQKGTGKWTVEAALDNNVPLTLITEAVFARILAAQKEERVAAAKVITGSTASVNVDRASFIDEVESALYASKLCSYAQGFALMAAQSAAAQWDINLGAVALMWRGGCIIRSAFLGKIKEAFERNPKLANLLVDSYFAQEMAKSQAGWRRVVAAGVSRGIPMPAMTSALSYFDGYRCERLPANLLQAQRDYFGAHTYERIDGKRGEFHHTNWTGRGGTTASTAYNV